MGQIIQDGSIPLSFLKEAAKPLAASKKAGIFVAEVLHAVTQKEVTKSSGNLFTELLKILEGIYSHSIYFWKYSLWG